MDMYNTTQAGLQVFIPAHSCFGLGLVLKSQARRSHLQDLGWEEKGTEKSLGVNCRKKINKLLVKLFKPALKTANDHTKHTRTHKHSLYLLHVSTRVNLSFAVHKIAPVYLHTDNKKKTKTKTNYLYLDEGRSYEAV